MNINEHELSIGINRMGDNVFLSIKVKGTLSHEDYQVMVPAIESALEEIAHPTIDVLVDAIELEGWELRAAWDDLKLGLKHGKEFRKIAFYGNKKWQQLAAKIGSWFIGGEIKYFSRIDEALMWLNEG